MTKKIDTNQKITWCPGCYNYQILAGVKNVLENKKNVAIVTGIGCHGKIFDYLNLPGVNSLHGRAIPTALGIKIGNPNLNVLTFVGDGDCYAEGLDHLIHAARYNSDFKVIVFNNQVFSLTVGQSTPTTEIGFKDKTNPIGVKNKALNPIKLMLASGATFVARVFADVKQVEKVLEEALKHKGFAFVEIIQPCIIFHPDQGYKEKSYDLQQNKHDKSDLKKAMEKSDEFDYSNLTKIPIGIFYQKKEQTFEEKFSQLSRLMKSKKSWRDIRR